MKKLIIGILISLIAVGVLLVQFDFGEFEKLRERLSYFYLLPFLISGLLGFFIFSVRWRILLEKKITMKHAFASCLLGGGANQILPARGGDLLRLYYCKSETKIPFPGLVSKIFIEKVIDFIAVIMIGLISFFLLGLNRGGALGYAIFAMSLFIIAAMIAFFFIIHFWNQQLINWGRKVFSFVKKEKFFDEKIREHIVELGEFLSVRLFVKPFLLTSIMWLFAYAGTYYSIQEVVGIHFGYVHLLFIMFCGAMGVALPSAPSGIGVFHASVTSGFLLIGKSSAEGLVFATVMHLAQFVFYSLFALVIYLYWTWRRRHPIHPT